MIEVFRRYRVHPAQARAFEHAFGSTGPWSKFFARSSGFRRVRLFRHKHEPQTYVQIQVWEAKSDWEAFLAQYPDDYRRIAKELRPLVLEQQLLGYHEGTSEYQPPVDARA
ncbi:MAG: antibiotic biosynthesis monooxygenase [Candidatus Eremiobacteraeota bacterium]|nr:antibiotic biosynthesis monooxygenase [Candidatus Eremiobacteraeota bacterium]